MARQATAHPDDTPNLPSLILSMANCWREIHAAPAGTDPAGANHAALSEVRKAIEAATDRITGQSGFLSLTGPRTPQERRHSVLMTHDSHAIS